MKKILLISSLVLVLLLSAGLLSYRFYFAKAGFELPFLSDFFEKKPEKVLDLMMENTPKLNSFAYRNNADIKVDYELKQFNIKSSYLVNMETSGAFNKFNSDEIKNEQTFKGSLDLGGMAFFLELETKEIGRIAYLKMNVIPFLFKLFLGDNSEGKWYEMKEDDWDNLDEMGSEQALNVYGVQVKENKEKQEKLLADIKEYIKNNNLLEVKEKLKEEKIDGRKNYHYKVSLRAEFIEGLKEVFFKFVDEELISDNDIDFDQEQLEAFKNIINQFDKLITKTELELWIDKKGFYPTKINFDVDLDFSKIEIPEKFDMDLDYNLLTNIKGSFELSKINEDIKIEKPTETTPLMDIFNKEGDDSSGLFGARQKSRDARRVADIKQIQAALELYFNDNNNYPVSVVPGGSIGEDDILYMLSVPSNPIPNDGVCDIDFEYKYVVSEEGNDYRLIYCLGNNTADILAGYNIASPTGIYSGVEFYEHNDSDGDGLSNYEENFIGTDPFKADTDGDGYSDYDEVIAGYNPLGDGRRFEDGG